MLLELAARCEAATGPDRNLDADIAAALGFEVRYDRNDPTPYYEPIKDYSWQPVPLLTASIDAALTLVPEGWWLQHLGDCIGGHRCRIETNGPPSQSVSAGFDGKKVCASCALAIYAAALRARAAQ